MAWYDGGVWLFHCNGVGVWSGAEAGLLASLVVWLFACLRLVGWSLTSRMVSGSLLGVAPK